jgi:hypothetical protein
MQTEVCAVSLVGSPHWGDGLMRQVLPAQPDTATSGSCETPVIRVLVVIAGFELTANREYPC